MPVKAQVKNQIRKKYIVKVLKEIRQFLGIHIRVHYQSRMWFELSQQRYIETRLHLFYLQQTNIAYTPAVNRNSLDKFSKDQEKV